MPDPASSQPLPTRPRDTPDRDGTPPACADGPIQGIPGYNLLTILDAGERWTIVRAIDEVRNHLVICKLLEDAAARPREAAALRQEYAILREMRGGEAGGYRLIDLDDRLVMIRPDGGGMPLARTPLPLDTERFLRLALQITDALATVHSAGYAHLQLSPERILWNAVTGAVAIVDFTGARPMSGGSPPPRPDPTPYMAPEQTGRLGRGIDYRADFYSLGACFYHLLTGQPPFGQTDPLDLFHAHVARSPIAPHRLIADVPAMLSAIVMRMMAKDPERRYQSCFGLKADLEQCFAQWRKKRIIADFPPGKQDRQPTLIPSKRLYGRDRAFAELSGAFAGIAFGDSGLVLISGESGIGKSSLVTGLAAEVAARSGRLHAGKFESLRRDVPYAPIAQSIAALLGDAARQDEDLVVRLLAGLGPDAGALTEVMPGLITLLGPLSPPAPLDPQGAQSRFIHVFCSLLGMLAEPAHPLVLFFDDLQWADLSSLKLLEALAGNADIEHFLLVGAYRDNEVDALHPLHGLAQAARSGGLKLTSIRLDPLDPDAVVAMLADMFAEPREAVIPLAQMLHQQTHGNPFFLRQYLDALEQSRQISFDHVHGHWNWDLASIAERQIGRDLGGITQARIRDLPGQCMQVLEAASCIGSRFDNALLSAVLDLSPEEVVDRLWPSLGAGLIVPEADRSGVGPAARFRFAHDQIEQGVYAQLPKEQAGRLHLAIGRTLKAGTDDANRLFDAVSQLNRALGLLAAAECIDLARDNLTAARAARSSVAVAPARNYLKAGLAALPADAWRSHYDLTLALHLESAELAVWADDEVAVMTHLALIEAEAAHALDRVRGLEVLIVFHITRQNPGLALDAGRQALALLGAPLPEKIGRRQVMGEMLLTRLHAFGKNEARLSRRLAAPDLHRAALGRILFLCAAPSYFADIDLLTVIVCRATRLCLASGCDDWVATSYAYWGVILASRLGRYREAGLFGRLALRFADERGDRPQAIFMVKAFIEPWEQPVGQIWPGLIDAYRAMMAHGDFLYAHLALGQVVIQRLFMGSPLDALAEEATMFRASAEKTAQKTSIAFLKVFQQTIASLRGQTEQPTSFAGPFLDQSDREGFARSGNLRALWQSYAMQAYVSLLFGQKTEARSHVTLYRSLPVSSLGQVADLRHAAIGSIIDYVCWAQLTPSERREAEGRARGVAARLAEARRRNPSNFAAIAELLEAERRQAHGQDGQAEMAYLKAMDAARTQGFPHDEAFAAERGAELVWNQGRHASAEALFRQAERAYQRWGASAKVDDLARRRAKLFDRSVQPSPAPALSLGRRRGATTIDVDTVIHASHALAEQIRLPDLLVRLMRLVLANAGATHGYLLLETDRRWRVEAEATADGDHTRVLQGLPLEGLNRPVRETILEVIARPEPIVQYNGRQSGEPCSVLCLPLRNGARLTGILYLENRLSSGVFSRERVDLLSLLSTQMAIFIENARLYDHLAKLNDTLEQEVAARTREAEEKSLLLEATLGNMSEGLMAFDRDGRLVVHNRRAFDLLGLGWLSDDETREAILRRLGITEGDTDAPPQEIHFPDGRVIQLRRNPVAGGGWVYVCLDLTEERHRQQELREARGQADLARQEAEHANHAKTVFLASVGHDLRQPAQAMRLLTSVLQARLADHPAADITLRMENALTAQDRILDSLLDISRLEAGIVPITIEEIDAAPFLEEMAEMIGPQALVKDILVIVEPTGIRLSADRAALSRVLANLLDNAVKYTDRGSVRLSARAEVTNAIIEVSDTGPGVPVDRAGAIFDDFVQLGNPERSQTKGLGLGLAIARRLVCLMGGGIGVRPAENGGSVFWVALPLR